MEIEEPNKQKNGHQEQENNNNNVEIQDENDEQQEKPKLTNREKKQQKKLKKQKLQNQVNEDELSDYETDVNIQMKTAFVHNLVDIPEFQRNRLAFIECNPYNLIIEKIPIRVSEQELKEFFINTITTLKPELSNPCPVTNLEFSDQKIYATVTFASKEVKQLIKESTKDFPLRYNESQIKLVNPKVFFKGMAEKVVLKKEGNEERLNQILEEEQNKLYMGGFPTYLTEEQVRKIAETYGPLKIFNLIIDPMETDEKIHSRGYCFFQYEDPKQTQKALAGLNGLEVGDRKLKVQKASQNQIKGQLNMIQGGRKAQPSNHSGSFLGSCEQIKYKSVQEMLNIPESATTPSRVVQFLNMICAEDLLEDDIYEELMEDIQSECKTFGPIEKIVIPRPDKETGLCPPSIGKVFVKFLYLLPAKKARHNLSGRTYNKRTVIGSFYPESKFDKKEYLINL